MEQICVNEGQRLSELASLKEDRVWFSRKTVVLDSRTISSGSISHVDNDGEA